MATQTNRALEILAQCGWLAGIVERKVSRIVTHDLFGFIDIIAVKPSDDCGILGLQVTSANGGNCAARVKKLLQEPNLRTCLESGMRVEVWALRDEPDQSGSMLRARTFIYEDKNLRVIEGSLIVDA